VDGVGDKSGGESEVLLLEDFFGQGRRRNNNCGYLAQFQTHDWAMSFG
jgi:hypothetical protein